MNQASPNDSRYIPLTQQAACCVPTCIQMVMYKEQIPLVPAEEIGFHLGLVVAPARSFLFYKVRISEIRPPAGYGTQINDPKYEPNAAFRNLGLPLSMQIDPVEQFDSAEDLLEALRRIEARDGNGLLCFNH